jgi:long-chain acyl-CoA synthetase
MSQHLETRRSRFEPREDLGSMTGLLARTAAALPDQPALVHETERISYSELHERAQRVAAGLAAEGLGAGDRIALLLPNTPPFVVSFFAAASLGATVVPLNPLLKETELEFYFRECRVRAVIAEPRRLGVVRRIGSRIDWPIELLATAGTERRGPTVEGLERHAPRDLPEPAANTEALYQYSAGSTGRPKRVPRTHAQLCTEAEGFVAAAGIRPEDTILGAIPLFHTYGLGCCLAAAVRSGATLRLIHERQPFALSRRRALELLSNGEATIFPAVPFMLRLLAETPGAFELARLRLCFSAAAALPLATFDRFKERFGISTRQLYGCTEAGTLTANLDDDPEATALSVGRPLDHVDIRILDDDGTQLEPGRIGEIAVRSGSMMRGYTGADELNREVFADDYFRTGDRGRLDDEGRLFITGRTKLLIDVSGDKVDPIEVEDVLATHPKVSEVVVVGVPTQKQGEELVRAVVVAQGACTDTELIRFCRERLANYKAPQQVEFRDEIPKSADGAVLRKYLVD